MGYVIHRQSVVCSLGGITNTFMTMNGLSNPENLNYLWKEHPECFDWKKCDPVTGECSSWIGGDIWQSPIWARSYALKSDGLKSWTQIGGHTPVAYLDFIETIYGDQIREFNFDNDPLLQKAHSQRAWKRRICQNHHKGETLPPVPLELLEDVRY